MRPAARPGRVWAGVLCGMLWCGLAGPLRAERGFAPDFDALFEEHAAEIATPSPGTEVLELPGPVILTRRSGAGVRAEDQSGYGRAGCALQRLVEVTAAVQLCPALLSAAERDRLATLLMKAAAFAGRNTHPPLPEETRRAALMTELAAARQAHPGACPTPEADWVRFARSLATDGAARRFERIFSVPRLPLAQPCP
ncbi:hypothetical protein [Alloyangia pacifica]|uniref:hypothetical protein n=1 Tax=Alloyangia pacifica TaxID=311180 RepID=UPI001CD3022B|nr:hypothetical protein [Alloyangia pacifica]MCA0996196.1 hypothetical protein [Alloyangia pacifica]